MIDSGDKLKASKVPQPSARRIERERRAVEQLAAAYDDPLIQERRGAAVAASLALDGTGGSVLAQRLAKRVAAVRALAEALRPQLPDLARLEPDLDQRVDGLVWAEVVLRQQPDLDPAAIAELVRHLAPGTRNPDGAPKRTETWTRSGFLAEYEQSERAVRDAGGRATREAVADKMSISIDTLDRLKKDFPTR